MKTEYINEFALIEMFRRVGLDMSNVQAIIEWAEEHGDFWYETISWTEEEQEDFRDWLYRFLARHTQWTARTRKKECGWFILMWGWTTNKKENKEC